MAKAAKQYPWNRFKNKDFTRQFKKLTDIGTNALENKNQLKLVGLKRVDRDSFLETGRMKNVSK